MSLEPNTVLNNRYRILEQLGRGGMGAVYRAHDANLDVEVAVKENFFVSEESARQFQREAHLLFELRHSGLPRVMDHFVVEDQGQYLVMDYIEGDDADQLLKLNEGPLEEGLVIRWGLQILDALKFLHSRKPPVIHRDIKPSNIKITTSGRAILVDFGLAKEYDSTKSTTVGAKAYTPGFAPPEQYGQGRTDPRTDIYAFGATLYNLLTNTVPADGLQRAMGQAHLAPLRELNQDVSPHVAATIERATQVKPEERFDSADEFERALLVERTVVDSTATRLAGVAAPAVASEPQPRRSRVPLIAGAIVVLAIGVVGTLLLSGAVLGLGGSPQPTPAPTITSAPSPTPAPPTAEQPIVLPPPTEKATQPLEPSDTPEATEVPPPTASPTLSVTPVGGGPGQIAFTSERAGLPQIFLVDVNGENLVQLTTLIDGACQPAWSPDGDRLLFTSPCRQKSNEYSNAAIYVMNADGSGVAPLISLIGGVYDPAWSRSGIAFTYLETGQPSLWMAEPDGSAPRKITIGTARDRQVSWSPGEDKLVLMNTSRAGSPTLFWVFSDGSFDGSNPDQVTRDQVSSRPAWSPLGDLVAYTSNQHIWVVTWDSVGFGSVRISDKGPNDGSSWSPDGQWIAFETWRDAANHDIYMMTPNGAQPTRITSHTANDYHPAWRP